MLPVRLLLESARRSSLQSLWPQCMNDCLREPVRVTAPGVRESGCCTPTRGLCLARWTGPPSSGNRRPTRPDDPLDWWHSPIRRDSGCGCTAFRVRFTRSGSHDCSSPTLIDVEIGWGLFPDLISADVRIRLPLLDGIDPDDRLPPASVSQSGSADHWAWNCASAPGHPCDQPPAEGRRTTQPEARQSRPSQVEPQGGHSQLCRNLRTMVARTF